MSSFKSKSQAEGTQLNLAFSGQIDEDVEFPQVKSGEYASVSIDLAGIQSINSVGIREWLNWIRPIAGKSKIVLENCPKPLVFQLNMVEGFLPKGSLVSSFFVPFFCEKCDREENILFRVGQDIELKNGNFIVNYDVKSANLCADEACELEMDASQGKYFQFLKRLP